MFYVIPKRYAVRGATSTDLQARNEVLLERELCFETDTLRFKIGDGDTPWNELPYADDTSSGAATLARISMRV